MAHSACWRTAYRRHTVGPKQRNPLSASTQSASSGRTADCESLRNCPGSTPTSLPSRNAIKCRSSRSTSDREDMLIIFSLKRNHRFATLPPPWSLNVDWNRMHSRCRQMESPSFSKRSDLPFRTLSRFNTLRWTKMNINWLRWLFHFKSSRTMMTLQNRMLIDCHFCFVIGWFLYIS